ncbi:MAG: metal ABC transporter substrate-binding protein [Candidatus Binatia bacterium]
MHLTTLLLAMLLAVAPARAAETLHVVATTPDLGAIATAVGGDAVEVTSLARPGEDPHFVDARPSFIRVVNQAEAFVEGGAGLEAGWLAPLLDGARNPRLALGAPGRIAANANVAMKDVPTALDRSLGDVHPFGNPHYLLDPENGTLAARTIAAGLCAVDHTRCDTFTRNAETFGRTIDERLRGWQSALAGARGTKVVTYHRAFDYFAARFGLDVVGTLEPKPGIPPSPAHLAELVPRMAEAKVRLILVEPFREPKTADFVAEKTGAKVVRIPLMPGGPEAHDYVELLDYAVRQVQAALAP